MIAKSFVEGFVLFVSLSGLQILTCGGVKILTCGIYDNNPDLR